MSLNYWILLTGALLVLMALSRTIVAKLPVSTAMIYLLIGVLLGPKVLAVAHIDLTHSKFLEHLTELVVLVSLFTAGLKMRVNLRNRKWITPLLLATVTMVLTIAAISATAMLLFHLSLGASVLLAAILAPTDPVLASEVQVADEDDHDRLRFSLTGEAGLNDGTAFPFVWLGLGLLGSHDLGPYGLNWIVFDLLWASLAAVVIGWVAGFLTAKLTLFLRQGQDHALAMDEFLALGLIAVSYSLANICHAYGFLATFAAAVAFRHFEMKATGEHISPASLLENLNKAATSDKVASAHLVAEVQGFSEQLESILELSVVVVLGTLVTFTNIDLRSICFVIILLFLIRPASVVLTLSGTANNSKIIPYVSWFGIRGVGSLFYLFFALNHGLEGEEGKFLANIVFTTLIFSIVLHGASATPLMANYNKKKRASSKTTATSNQPA